MTKEMEDGGRVVFHCTPYIQCGSGIIILLAPPPHVGPPPAICKVGVYVPSAHPMYGG